MPESKSEVAPEYVIQSMLTAELERRKAKIVKISTALVNMKELLLGVFPHGIPIDEIKNLLSYLPSRECYENVYERLNAAKDLIPDYERGKTRIVLTKTDRGFDMRFQVNTSIMYDVWCECHFIKDDIHILSQVLKLHNMSLRHYENAIEIFTMPAV